MSRIINNDTTPTESSSFVDMLLFSLYIPMFIISIISTILSGCFVVLSIWSLLLYNDNEMAMYAIASIITAIVSSIFTYTIDSIAKKLKVKDW